MADLLMSALRSVIVEANALRNAGHHHPVIEPGAGNDEIIEQLAAFRRGVKEMERREALVIARITQARTWAQNLKRMAPALRSEINMFRLATAQCSALQASWSPDPHASFNGGKRPQNAIDRRYRKVKWADGRDGGVDYEICGKVAASEIVTACESLLARLIPHYEREIAPLPEDAWAGRLAIEAHPHMDAAHMDAEDVVEEPALDLPLELRESVAREDSPTREELDGEETAKGMETLMGLGVRARETMRLARAVEARAMAEAEIARENELTALAPLDTPSEGTPAPVIKPVVGPVMRRLPMTPLDLAEEILIPLDADDFFAGVPGAELGRV